MNKISGLIRRCVDDYAMINEGDEIAVGISGGKDSLLLLAALVHLKTYYPKKFGVHGITIDLGFEGMDFGPVTDYCAQLGVPYSIIKSDIAQVVFDERREKNPCSLCAKMRRGALNDAIRARGISKLALGHHFDDAVETFFMSLFFEGRISCFDPVTYMTRTGVTQIRPMLYVGEGAIRGAMEQFFLPVVSSTCPMDGASKREEIKQLVGRLSKAYPDLRNKVFGAMQRYPLKGWEPEEYTRRPLS